MDYNISLYLDKRKSSKKTNDLFPVKLRVYSSLTQSKKLYPTGKDLSIEDFDNIFSSAVKIRGKKKETKIFLQSIENKAEDIAKNLNPFTFEKFEKKLFRSKGANINVEYHYKSKIETLRSNNQFSTASNYDLSLKSLTHFIHSKFKGKIHNLNFYDVTTEWLTKYENFMINEKDRSRTTVSIYLRTLRTIFNDAISENEIKRDIYPFGKAKGKYQIPTSTSTKKSLTREQLKELFNAQPQTKEEEMAKDFWFFSYACNGMNIKDIAYLNYGNIEKDSLKYYRAKTMRTKKGNLKVITIFLNDFAKSIVEKYGNKIKTKNQIIFPIFANEDGVEKRQKKIKNFTSFVNLYFNKLAKRKGFDFKITTYWARHSFATISIQKGASMEFISEALNHSNLNVTKIYFAGFEDDVKKDFANQLMDF